MGMYTGLSLGIELRDDIPDDIVQVLSELVSGEYNPMGGSPAWAKQVHPFFRTDRCLSLFHCDSYYFDYDTGWTFRKDHISETYFLSGVSNLKNYDNEIRKFLDWIAPYINESVHGFVGWTMYEEQWSPDLIIRGRPAGVDGKEDSRLYIVPTELFASAAIEEQLR